MKIKLSRSYLAAAIVLGAVWGFSEAALGMWLRNCASLYSGAIMTGVALFFLASSWYLSQNILSVVLLVGIAALFKMFDALLLSLPLTHGAIGNPIFAFFTEGMALLLMVMIFNEKLKTKRGGQALMGGMSALLAVNLFPLVKYITGVPACVVPGTGYPLSLYYAPLAVALSLVTFPLGAWAGAKIQSLESVFQTSSRARTWHYIFSPGTLLLCLAIIAFMRLF
ncbi:MAG: hypothetical protein ACE5L7_10080 [Candidatus Aminicenantales bacterium]